MQSKVDEILTHIAHSHQQLARVLDAKRQVAVRMSEIINHLPDIEPELDGVEGLLDSSGQINKSIISYLGPCGSGRSCCRNTDPGHAGDGRSRGRISPEGG